MPEARPAPGPTTRSRPGSPDHPWTYVYGVGGSSLHWPGNTPRFLPEDLRLRSEYGVMADWPIAFDDLLPWYLRAEQALGVAGAPPAPPGVRPAGAASAGGPSAARPRPQPHGPARPPATGGLRPPPSGSPFRADPGPARLLRLGNLRAVSGRLALLGAQWTTGGARPPAPDSPHRDGRLAAYPGCGRRRVAAVEAIDPRGERARVTARGTSWPRADSRTRPSCCARDWAGKPRAATCSTTATRRSWSRSDAPPNPVTGRRWQRDVQAFLRGRFRARASGALVTPFNPGTAAQPAGGRRARSAAGAAGVAPPGARRVAPRRPVRRAYRGRAPAGTARDALAQPRRARPPARTHRLPPLHPLRAGRHRANGGRGGTAAARAGRAGGEARAGARGRPHARHLPDGQRVRRGSRPPTCATSMSRTSGSPGARPFRPTARPIPRSRSPRWPCG